MLFGSGPGSGGVLLLGTLACFALILLLRMSGKRTLTKLNAFDLVVTVAPGSMMLVFDLPSGLGKRLEVARRRP